MPKASNSKILSYYTIVAHSFESGLQCSKHLKIILIWGCLKLSTKPVKATLFRLFLLHRAVLKRQLRNENKPAFFSLQYFHVFVCSTVSHKRCYNSFRERRNEIHERPMTFRIFIEIKCIYFCILICTALPTSQTK